MRFSKILTFSVLFPRWHPIGPSREKHWKRQYLEIYDIEHLFLRPDFGILEELPILEVSPFPSANYHPYLCTLIITLNIYIWLG